jgi:Family of unknown function (DUF5681)
MGSLIGSDAAVTSAKPWQWQKGVSGNPLGRPQRAAALGELLRVHLGELVGETGRTRGQELVRVLVDLAMGGDVQAIRTILERTDGRLGTQLELSADGGASIAVILRWPERVEVDV